MEEILFITGYPSLRRVECCPVGDNVFTLVSRRDSEGSDAHQDDDEQLTHCCHSLAVSFELSLVRGLKRECL